MLEYETPEGYEDMFFMYVYDAGVNGLVNSGDYTSLRITITDGDFICREWAGAYSILAINGLLQIYEQNWAAWFSLPVSVYNNFPQAVSVLPEKKYNNNSSIFFDLTGVQVRTV